MNQLSKEHAIEELIQSIIEKTDGITSEQIALARELYLDDSRELSKIKEELLSYRASIIENNHKIPMKKGEVASPYYINVSAPIKGIYLGETQIDLITIVEIATRDELQEFITSCAQLNYSSASLQQFQQMDLETAKRKVFEDYRATLIGTIDLKKDPILPLRKKIDEIGLSEEETEAVISLCKEKNIDAAVDYIITKIGTNYTAIKKKLFRKHNMDWEDVKCASYEEFVALAKQLSNFNCVTVTSGKYYLVMNNGKFDPYHIKRELDFCKKHGIQARYHSLLTKGTLEQFKGQPKERVTDSLRNYVRESIHFINSYNEENKLKNGNPVIRSVVIFNELVNLKKDKKQSQGYYNIWEKLGITTADIVDIFAPAIGNKSPDIEYVYNEAFVETEEKRQVQLQLAQEIHILAPELIDVFGTQMHITTEFNSQTIEKTFLDLKQFSEDTGIKLAITEFDMFVPRKTLSTLSELGKNQDQIDQYANYKKKFQLEIIAQAATKTKVDFSEVAYWSTTDSMDHNKKREHVSTLYGGVFGNQLNPKGAKEVVDYSPQIERPESTIDVLDYINSITSMLETTITKVTDDYKENTDNQYVKKRPEATTGNAQDDSGFASFPQLLVMTLIVIAILYIILM